MTRVDQEQVPPTGRPISHRRKRPVRPATLTIFGISAAYFGIHLVVWGLNML